MAVQLTTDALRPALAGEFRAAIEAVLGTVLTATDGQAPGGAGWGTPITAAGSAEGQFTAWVDQPGVTAIAKAMLDVDGTPEPGVAAEMLKEIWSQAAAAVALKAGFEGLRLEAGSSTPG